MDVSFPQNHKFLFSKIFGDNPRTHIIEFFIITSMNGKNSNPPWTYISQISRILNLSKSSVKKTIDDLLDEGFLIEKKIKTHAQNPQRDVRIKKDNPLITELQDFYKKTKFLL